MITLKKKVIKGLIVVLCMLSIFLFSTDNSRESTSKSNRVILGITNLFHKDLSNKEKEKIIDMFFVPIRKMAHFGIYLVLGISLISFLREFSIPILKLLLLSIFLAFLYACSDEIHQLFVPGRSGRFSDVLLDTLGASVGIFIYYLLFRKRLNYEQEERVG